MLFAWDPKKNQELQSEGRPTFEDAVKAIKMGVMRDDKNPIYPGQRIFVVAIDDYPHIVPYETRKNTYWLITVYPSRKHKR